ncbi:hypothetical protein LB505_010505 [Fusarium chuoi]|nr:hypothetical protein LB505_010505 [Fusarium chuoi]
MDSNSSDTSYLWQRSLRGLWERQIDECESVYWLYTKKGHGCYPITVCASFQLKISSKNGHGDDIEALKNAWVFLRHRHPTLGSRIERDDEAGKSKRIYKPFENNEDAGAWLSSTFHIINTDKSALERFNGDAPIFAVPTSSPGTKPEFKAKRIAVSVPKGIFAQILAGCQNLGSGVTLTRVFVSALAMDLAEFQPRKQETYTVRYVDRPMLNLKPFCKDPYRSPDHAGATYHAVCAHALGFDFEVPGLAAEKDVATKALPKIALDVRDFYNKHKPNLLEEIHEQVLFAPLTFISQFPPSGGDPWCISNPPFCPVSLSSIGNLSSVMTASSESFDLTNVWSPANQSLLVSQSSWGFELLARPEASPLGF